jgi:hypothetical protein
MTNDLLAAILNDYIDGVNSALHERIFAWDCSIADREVRDSIGGLMARQTSLATNFAANPGVWNAHVAPIFLRCMADVYITFCWIITDPQVRCRQFIEYGLGQEKLAIEKYKEQVLKDGNVEPGIREFVETREKMLDMEKHRFLVPVNLGSWSEMSTRAMAQEIGEEHFYNYVFVQFSSSVHSTWQHIWRFNLRQCTNPLHGYHRVPANPHLPPDLQQLMNAANYLCKVFHKFDCVMLKSDDTDYSYSTHDFLERQFIEFGQMKTG